MKIIAVMEKERSALHKVHRQYQKDRVDQDTLESEYSDKIRKVNEELRIGKARVQKYRYVSVCACVYARDTCMCVCVHVYMQEVQVCVCVCVCIWKWEGGLESLFI